MVSLLYRFLDFDTWCDVVQTNDFSRKQTRWGQIKICKKIKGCSSTSTDCWVQLPSARSLYAWGLIQRGRCPFPCLKNLCKLFHIHFFFKFEWPWKLVKFTYVNLKHAFLIFHHQPWINGIPTECLMSLLLTNMHCSQSIIRASEVN